MATYAEKLKHPKWQKKRLEIFSRDNFTCQLCDDTKTTLNVHHLKYTRLPWEAKDEDLITYCEYCHFVVEFHKKQNLTIVACYKYINSDTEEQAAFFILKMNENSSIYLFAFNVINKNILLNVSLSEDTQIHLSKYIKHG